jgi:hypothetical protein
MDDEVGNLEIGKVELTWDEEPDPVGRLFSESCSATWRTTKLV